LRTLDFSCNKSDQHTCHSCQLGKHVHLPFGSSETTTHFPFQLVHSEVWTSPVLSHSGSKYYVPIYIWTFPTYLINRRPCRATGTTTPHELLVGVPPHYDELRVFGCLCFPNLSATTSNKLSPRSSRCVFLGYPTDHRGYRCLDLATRRVITSRHVVFDELCFPFRERTAAPPPSPIDVPVADDHTLAIARQPPRPRAPSSTSSSTHSATSAPAPSATSSPA
jgi:hypothetical protein